MKQGDRFEVQYKGQTIACVLADLAKNGFIVQMLEPYKVLISGPNVPWFAIQGRCYENHGETTGHGEKAIYEAAIYKYRLLSGDFPADEDPWVAGPD